MEMHTMKPATERLARYLREMDAIECGTIHVTLAPGADREAAAAEILGILEAHDRGEYAEYQEPKWRRDTRS